MTKNQVKILYFVVALGLYILFLFGLGTIFILLIGVDTAEIEGFKKFVAWALIGGMPIGCMYAIFCGLDFATYMAKQADKIDFN